MRCSNCEIDNSVDSLFCKHCGRRLIVRRPNHEPQLDFEKLINDGYDAVHAGRAGEALLAVEGILRTDPLNTSALALKALVHERNGEIDSAIDTYEQLVALNPESTQDRRRLMELRSRKSHDPEAKRSTASPFLPAIITGGALLVVLLAFMFLVIRNASATKAAGSDEPSATGKPPVVASNGGTSIQNPAYGGYSPPATYPQPVRPPTNTAVPNGDEPTNVLVPPLNGSNLYVKDPPKEDAGTAENKTSDSAGDGSVVMPDPNAGTDKPKDNEKKSIIDIKVTKGGGGGGSAVAPDQASANYFKIGRAEQQQGNYRAAISAYQKALAGPAYKGAIHQAIAICHYRLGDRSAAATSYQQAIDEYSRQIKDNVDAAVARSGLNTCRAGLRACQG